MTTIIQENNKWYVVKQLDNPIGINVWVKISEAFDSSYDARAYQLEIIMGRA